MIFGIGLGASPPKWQRTASLTTSLSSSTMSPWGGDGMSQGDGGEAAVDSILMHFKDDFIHIKKTAQHLVSGQVTFSAPRGGDSWTGSWGGY